MAELWFDPAARSGDRDVVAAASQLLLDDERTFIDLPASPLWMAEEDVYLAGPTEGLRMTAVLRRHPSITRDEFRRPCHEAARVSRAVSTLEVSDAGTSTGTPTAS